MNTNKFTEYLEEIVTEIHLLNEENVSEWIEENIIEIKNNNELLITVGGPSIRLYIDSGVLIGQKGFSSDRVFVDCNTRIINEYLEMFREIM